MSAAAMVEALTRPADDNYYPELITQYQRVRRFVPTLLKTVTFEGTQAAQPVLQAVRFLASIEQQRKPDMSKAPLKMVPRAWRKRVMMGKQQVDRRAYTLCVLEHLHDRLRRRDIFVTQSERWSNPRTKLLHGDAWETARPHVCRSLGRQETATEELVGLKHHLHEAYQRTAEHLPTNSAVRIESHHGRETLIVSNLDKLEEPHTLLDLRQQVLDRLPQVTLPQVLLST